MKRCFLIFLASLAFSISAQVIDQNLLQNLQNLQQNQNFQSMYQENLSEEELEPLSMKKEKVAQKSEIYGHDIVNNQDIESKDAENIPLPNDYKISINDVLQVILSGTQKQVYTLKVNQDGNILFPDLGTINVSGQSISSLNEKLTALIEAKFFGTEVQASIKNASGKKITVLGAVKSPGLYVVSPFTTVLTALSYAGGLEDYASLRTIELQKMNGEILTIDLYNYLIDGDIRTDIILDAGDTLLVKGTGNFLKLQGEVFREMIYEYHKDDTYKNIINFGLGLTSNASSSNIFAEVEENSVIENILINEAARVEGTKILSIYVPSSGSLTNQGIRVIGSEVSGGLFRPEDYENLDDLINSLSFGENLYPFFATLTISDENSFISNTFSFNIFDSERNSQIKLGKNIEIKFFDFQAVKNFNAYYNYVLEKEEKKLSNASLSSTTFSDLMQPDISSSGDSSELKESFDENYFQEDQFLEEKGEKFGSFFEDETLYRLFYESSLTLNISEDNSFLLPVAGKFSPINIINYLGKEYVNLDYETVLITSPSQKVTKLVEVSEKIESGRGVTINLPNLDRSTVKVKVSGFVNNPGQYIVSNNTNLIELYEIVGGFSENANTEGILFQRQSLKIAEKNAATEARLTLLDTIISSLTSSGPLGNGSMIDSSLFAIYQQTDNLEFFGRLSGDLSPTSELAKKTILEEGDEIYVPARSNEIRIIGQVQNPLTTSFSNDFDLDDYIKRAGGFTKFADKSSVYIIQSNGITKDVKSGLFKSDLMFIKPGDTIVVPRNFSSQRGLTLASLSVQLLSQLALTAASLNAIQR